MARCPNCGTEMARGAHYCPECGAAQLHPETPEQPPLPFSPWSPPRTLQPAGVGATAPAETAVGPPLSGRSVAIAVGSILLFLFFIILVGRGMLSDTTSTTSTATGNESLPVLGTMGEAVETGNTVWAVAFTDHSDTFDNRQPTRGQFFVVGLVVRNTADAPFTLSAVSTRLTDAVQDGRYQPTFTAWGTPDDLQAGQYRTEYPLQPGETIAGLVIFDVPNDLAEQRLLIKDLSKAREEYAGTIDLTKEAE